MHACVCVLYLKFTFVKIDQDYESRKYMMSIQKTIS
jgi:hypothetical protein